MNRLPTTKHDDFDHSSRQLQRQAEAALSPATLARLRQGRRQATATDTPSPWRHRGWWLATACSAVLAVTVALQFNATPPAVTSADIAAAAGTTDDDASLLFDESPELYLWLGSDALALE
ncbi:MAG: hypothetical protein WA956_11355 [Stenotrophomonas sp.]